ncbi:uncharacterized protein TRIVIDRAFT_54988 [Trichoderma virens Gv29-8]|uniref:DUF6546 domain-containing protein n=1 Tax=Hypocrea virens (strain Gv29-8 / FGSC 10586) TaxID=413071 RepID=G9MJB6_HYPVG|nr:uncharacterized protein TRIVIDRAFT_54988 [Trichoderma virens Gv29-8]EHK25579.1 hypothetical protein TRIVIDRAFT_54988 [Trichoderma virens Gv29-8]
MEKSAHWFGMPREIRLMILEKIAHDKHPGWGSLASTCREWQYVIEQCLYQLGEMVTTQRQYHVRHIWVNIELPKYGCTDCESRESRPTRERNDIIMETAISQLFSVICFWPWQPEKGLKLELNAYSESDSQHYFKHYHIGAQHEESPGDLPEAASRVHDARHGWINGQRFSPPHPESIWRLFSAMFLRNIQGNPRVAAVTSLVIRRQFRRSWESIFSRWLPESLKRIVVFEDSNDDISSARNYYHYPPNNVELNAKISKIFVERSLHLDQLAVSYMIDAKDFFRSCQKTWTWLHLQSLALTSTLLCSKSPRQGAADLLHDAAGVAMNMPSLHTMVLWYGKKKDACAFIYQNRAGTASVTWRSTWYMDLDRYPKIAAAWNRVSFKTTSRDIFIRQELIQNGIYSHGDAIHYLRLPCTVVDSVSLWQIRREVAQSTYFGR